MHNQPHIAVRRRRGRRHWRFVFLVLSVILIGQEVVCRLMFPLPEVIGFNRVHYQTLAPWDARSSPLIKRGLVYERLGFQSQPDGFSEVHRLNLYGFRGGDFAIDPIPDRRRILVLGDSIVEGQGAAEEDTIPSALINLLREDGRQAEVLNLGVVAASLSDLTPLARDSISLLKPTDVILVLFANDLPAPRYLPAYDLPPPIFGRQIGSASPRMWELFMRLASDEPIYRRWPPHPVIAFFQPVPDASNPWTRVKAPPAELDPVFYEAMCAGTLNPWLRQQARFLPDMLAHDFSSDDGTPAPFLGRIMAQCQVGNARLVVAYVPFCGVTSGRYASDLVKMGMDPAIARALATDPIYRRQNEILASVCHDLNLPFADTTESLVQADLAGVPQYWSVDTHPRPVGYATIARHIYGVWRTSVEDKGLAFAPRRVPSRR